MSITLISTIALIVAKSLVLIKDIVLIRSDFPVSTIDKFLLIINVSSALPAFFFSMLMFLISPKLTKYQLSLSPKTVKTSLFAFCTVCILISNASLGSISNVQFADHILVNLITISLVILAGYQFHLLTNGRLNVNIIEIIPPICFIFLLTTFEWERPEIPYLIGLILGLVVTHYYIKKSSFDAQLKKSYFNVKRHMNISDVSFVSAQVFLVLLTILEQRIIYSFAGMLTALFLIERITSMPVTLFNLIGSKVLLPRLLHLQSDAHVSYFLLYFWLLSLIGTLFLHFGFSIISVSLFGQMDYLNFSNVDFGTLTTAMIAVMFLQLISGVYNILLISRNRLSDLSQKLWVAGSLKFILLITAYSTDQAIWIIVGYLAFYACTTIGVVYEWHRK